MSINFSNGTVISAPPRLIATYDSVSGCPPNRGTANLITSTFTITRPSTIYINAKTICSGSGRHDRGLYIQGPSGSGYNNGRYAVRLDYKISSWWEDAYIHWTGTFGVAGSYTVRFTQEGFTASCGCGGGYGRMNILILEN
jgi:hypothetical protein